MGFECKLAILCCSVLDRFPPGFVGFLPLEGAASTKTGTPTPRFENVTAFSDPFAISLASFVKMTWVLNVQCKFYEPTPSAHPWIGSQPGFVGFRCFLPHGGAASTKTSTPTPHFETFPAFSDPFSISLASFVKMTWVLNVQCKFYEPTLTEERPS